MSTEVPTTAGPSERITSDRADLEPTTLAVSALDLNFGAYRALAGIALQDPFADPPQRFDQSVLRAQLEELRHLVAGEVG